MPQLEDVKSKTVASQKPTRITYDHLKEILPHIQLEYHIHISLKAQYLYFEVPKVACSTIKRRLQMIELHGSPYSINNFDVHNPWASPMLSPYQLPLPQMNEFLNSSSVLRFTFVRNPFSRVLSAYLDKIMRSEFQKSFVLEALGYDATDLTQFVSFKEFLHAIELQPQANRDPHWAVQFDHIGGKMINYDIVGRFERFEDDWLRIVERVNVPDMEVGSIGQVNDFWNRTDASRKLESYYSDGTIVDHVRRIYADDFDNFGYPTDPDGS